MKIITERRKNKGSEAKACRKGCFERRQRGCKGLADCRRFRHWRRNFRQCNWWGHFRSHKILSSLRFGLRIFRIIPVKTTPITIINIVNNKHLPLEGVVQS